MTEVTGGESTTDFDTRARDFLTRLWHENPPSDETVALGAELAALAEGLGPPSRVIAFRYYHIKALQGAGRMDEALVEFPRLLSYSDRHPDDDGGHLALTAYKWMVNNAWKFPQVAKAQVEEMLLDFETRLRRRGFSLRPAHHARMDWAVALGKREEASIHCREWQAAPRDHLSDCPVCELHNRIEYLIFLGQDENAVSLGLAFLGGGRECTAVPDKTYGLLLTPLLRLERVEEALDLHHEGYRRISGTRRYIDVAADHITFLVRAGETEDAVRVFESFLPLALETTLPWKNLGFHLAGWLLLDVLRASESSTAELKLPAPFDSFRREGGYDLEAVEGWFRDRTLELARRFDERDGTDAYSQRVTAAFDMTWRATAQARTPAAEAPSVFPPESWFAAAAGGATQYVAFSDTRGETEFVCAEWEEENVFRVLQHPLRVDGVSRGDLVEVRWEVDDPTPRFNGVRERSGCRTVRVLASDAQLKTFLSRLDKFRLLHYLGAYRHEDGVFIFCISPEELEAFADEEGVTLQEMLPGVWAFTDGEL